MELILLKDQKMIIVKDFDIILEWKMEVLHGKLPQERHVSLKNEPEILIGCSFHEML